MDFTDTKNKRFLHILFIYISSVGSNKSLEHSEILTNDNGDLSRDLKLI